MTCMEAQALITPFINDKLDTTTLERFVDHVESCKECQEELEVYFAILTAMKQLDEDEEVSADFTKELKTKLKESQELVVKKKLIHIRKNILFFALVVMLGLVTSVSVSVVEEALNVSKEVQVNRFVIQHEVFSPYMDSLLLDSISSYQEIISKVDAIEQEKKEREIQIEEERTKRIEKQKEDKKKEQDKKRQRYKDKIDQERF